MMEPNGEQVKAVWAALQAEYGSKVVPKASAGEMQAAAWFLDKLQIMDHETFMQRFTTTINDTVYVPFEIGVARPGKPNDLWNQIELGGHEHQHVFQAKRDGVPVFYAEYLGVPQSRAQYEAEAYRVDVELHWWRYKQMPNLRVVAEKIRAYNCGTAEVDFIHEYLKMSADAIREGAVISEASQFLVAWLDQNAQELRVDNGTSTR